METINERIKKILDTLNMSQSDFARKINVTPAYVWKILNKNESTPSAVSYTHLDVYKRQGYPPHHRTHGCG